MHTLELIAHLPELTADEAEHWANAALAEAGALRQHDDRLYPLTDDPAALKTANGLHAAWNGWADDAEALLARIDALSPQPSAGRMREMRLAIGRARSIVQLSPAEFLRRRERLASGASRSFSPAEARRELGLAPLG